MQRAKARCQADDPIEPAGRRDIRQIACHPFGQASWRGYLRVEEATDQVWKRSPRIDL